jgi:uncharacterized protein (TIGR02246 family)
MNTDEQQIRELVATWMSATEQGDLDTVLGLMTDDVIFLIAGRPPMRGKEEFAATSRAQAAPSKPQFSGKSEIQEIQVAGDWAFMWSRLTVTMTVPGSTPTIRAGNTLSVLRRENGKWRLARDANLLTPVASTAT